VGNNYGFKILMISNYNNKNSIASNITSNITDFSDSKKYDNSNCYNNDEIIFDLGFYFFFIILIY
jgi:hypothetical protein